MIIGTPRINGLAVGEIHINFLANLRQRKEGEPAAAPDISVKAAFVDAEQGTSHGWTTAGVKYGGRPLTSLAVQETLNAFITAVEAELAQRHFVDVREADDTAEEEEDAGIGEHAGAREIETEPG